MEENRIDLDRCTEAMKQITVYGAPTTIERIRLVEEAITKIQDDPKTALSKEYLGIKNYAHFGDQREDHKYGYSPAHGSIVFSVRRMDRGNASLNTEDCIYLLLATLDFKDITVREDAHHSHKLGLCDWLKRYNDAIRKANEIFEQGTKNLNSPARIMEFL